MVVHSFDMELYRRREFGARGPAGVVAAAAGALTPGPSPAAAGEGSPVDAMVLDVSNYDWATFDAACLYASGVRRLIVGCQDEAIARRMIDAATSEGIEVIALYALVYFGGSSWHLFDDMEACLRVQADYGVRAIALDAEIDAATIWPGQPAPAGPAQRNDELLRCRRMVEAAGGRALVYTNASWWVPRHGDTTMFADLGLWYPHYGYAGALRTPIRDVAFGGWTRCVAHQAGSTYAVCGRGRDVNYLWEGMEEDDVELKGRVARLERLIGANGIDIEVDGALRRLTGEEALALADERDWSAFLGIGQLRTQVGPLAEAAGGVVTVPPGTVIRVAGNVVVQ